MLLQISSYRSCTEYRIVTAFDYLILSLRCKLYSELSVSKTLIKSFNKKINDITYVVLCKRLKHYYLIKPDKELRYVVASKFILHHISCIFGYLTILLDSVKQIL